MNHNKLLCIKRQKGHLFLKVHQGDIQRLKENKVVRKIAYKIQSINAGSS